MKFFLPLISLFLAINLNVFSQADVKSIVKIANELIEQNNYDAALEKFNEALDYLPSYAPALDGKSNLLILMGKYKDGGKLIEKAIEKNSDYPPYYLTRGKINVLKEKYEDAIEDLNRALDLGKGEYDNKFNSTIYVNRGVAYQKMMNNDAALNDYSKAILLDDKNSEVYLYRGFLYYKQEEYETAMNDFNTVIEIDPENPFAYYNRGISNAAARPCASAAPS